MQHDHRFGEEQYEPGTEHACAERCGPHEPKVLTPVQDRQSSSVEKENRAGPAPEARGDGVLLEINSANIAQRRTDESAMVIDSAAYAGALFYLLLRMRYG